MSGRLNLGDLRLGSGHEIIDVAGGNPVHVGLYQHGEQAPVSATTRLERQKLPRAAGNL
jgi:hypothetical protein